MTQTISAVLVHDQADAFRALKPALEGQSVQTRQARTCQETLRLLEGPVPPLLVFTDRQLPDGTWRDIVRLAESAHTPTSVIVVSRLTDVRLYVDAIEQGAYDFIVPPFEAAGLAHVVRCATAHTLDQRQKRFDPDSFRLSP